MYRHIDLFSGIGGFRLAVEDHFDSATLSVEIDKFARKTYTGIFGEAPWADDVRNVNLKYSDAVDILTAGFPCQPWSDANRRKDGQRGFGHRSAGLFDEVARLIGECRPQVVLLENVTGLLNAEGGAMFDHVLDRLTRLGYTVTYKVLDAADFSPMRRKRVFILGFRNAGQAGRFRWPQSYQADWHKDPDPICWGYSCETFRLGDRTWSFLQRHKAKQQAKGNGFGYHLLERGEVIPTITARYYKDGADCLIPSPQGNPRKLYPSELKRMFGFPDFTPNVSKTQLYKQFGNSVSVQTVSAIVKQIKEAAG